MRVTIIHHPSSDSVEPHNYTKQNTRRVTIHLDTVTPSLPVQEGDWYWVVVGSDSKMYELRSVTTLNLAGQTRLELRK